MKVYIDKKAGKNWGMYFEGESPLYTDIKDWVRYSNGFRDAEFHDVVKAAGVFIQSDQLDFLFLEFWGSDWWPFVEILRNKFDLKVEA